ncbi:MAG: T9SS type A sorting domain-containing protein, partial [Bacteroidetes bacterium]|nr:T9SS type A sorting domain-containing protein [Bacteroidota bacterium]
TIGSAQASAWLQTATGAAPLEEVIILPTDMQLRSSARHRERDRASHQPLLLDAYPNPSVGPVHVVCNVPEGVSKATLQIRDLNGRLLYDQRVEPGMGVAVLQAGAVAAGIYLAELRLDGIRAGQVKLALQ